LEDLRRKRRGRTLKSIASSPPLNFGVNSKRRRFKKVKKVPFISSLQHPDRDNPPPALEGLIFQTNLSVILIISSLSSIA